ncbi:MAG: cation-translocating P-type ATPase [Leptolyngbyaceae cyanobacterium MO_188.B28]|nr:cation-translocating P-type ATPase [Leptolyngbyaceae cyanobacterium MO_188.B28]
MGNWHILDSAEVIRQLETDAVNGLTQAEADQRLIKYGPNELTAKDGESPWLILWEQLTATVVLVLIAAALVSALMGEYKDAIAILAIVIFNAGLGFKQEHNAQQAIAALKKLAVPNVKVRRDGILVERSARELVPGDIVLLEAGNHMPADCRIQMSSNLRIQEASLTGEAAPVDKTTRAFAKDNRPLADRSNMAYMGTVVTYGRGVAIVTETGMATELGQIAAAVETMSREPTPLQQRLDQLGKVLAIAIMVLVTVIFILGLLRGEGVEFMFLTAVSLAVAAIPEGLPAVVTIALALGAQQMLKQRALVRKLPAVETLGSVTVICSDKTGTLTKSQMTVTCLEAGDRRINLKPHHYQSHHAQSHHDQTHHDQAHHASPSNPVKLMIEQPDLAFLLTGSALCNDALLERDPENLDRRRILGDPTEGALVIAANKLGLAKSDLENTLPRIDEIPFSAERKRMTTIHRVLNSPDWFRELLDGEGRGAGGAGEAQIQNLKSKIQNSPLIQNPKSFQYITFTKGAVDGLLTISSKVWLEGRAESLDETQYQRISQANNQLAQDGMRVLGVAFRLDHSDEIVEQDLIFLGMIGIVDPARPEAKTAVQTCQAAGVRPVMITGDHPLTAQRIAHELGIATNTYLLTGAELSQLSDEALKNAVAEVSVYARVSPQHKLAIVRALQSRGHIVAMTGDGVNDAPALKQADIGVAMGITGTDVAKEAADMVLMDDNFAAIVAATREGRVIYDNVRKFINYTLTGNCGELWVILLAPFLGMPLPLLPLQILWINLLADGLLALALGVEPAERGIMRRPPNDPNENIFSRGVGRDIIWIGALLGLTLLAIAYGYWSHEQAGWQTMVFSTLAFSRMGLAQAMRSGRESVFRMNLLANKPLLGAVLLTFSLQLMVVYVPFLQTIFQTTGLSAADLLISLVLSSVALWAMELEKWVIRRRSMA